MTKLLAQELGKSNPGINISISDVEKIKEQYSCCAEDELAYGKTENSCQTEKHTLPDGQVHVSSCPNYVLYLNLHVLLGYHFHFPSSNEICAS